MEKDAKSSDEYFDLTHKYLYGLLILLQIQGITDIPFVKIPGFFTFNIILVSFFI